MTDPAVVITFIAFLAITLAITAWAARQTRGTRDFYAAGGRITLHCASCGRTAVYIARTLSRSSLPEAPRPHPH